MTSDINGSSVAQPDPRAAKSKLKPSEVLSKAADLIAKPFRWTQKAMRRDRLLLPTSFCAVGAMIEVSGEGAEFLTGLSGRAPIADAAKRYADRATSWGGIVSLNDNGDTTKRQVVDALRKASELAKAEGQ